MGAILDLRYTFTGQFVHGAANFARHAHEIEGASGFTDEAVADHRAHVVGAVMQSAAAIESEIAEILMHGPGHHLGNDGASISARDFLLPVADVIDRQPPLRKYQLTLHLLNKPALDRGAQVYQNTDLLFRLRNELVHYKSKWASQMNDQTSVFVRLEALRFEKPPFTLPDMTFFPIDA